MKVKEEVRELWKLCFDDSDEFIEMYFRLRYHNESTMVIQSGNMIVSALQMPCYPMTFEGAEVQASYISGACTHPDFRDKGAMYQLLAESFSRMVQKNIPLSILMPAEPWLYDYYARTGYAPAFFYTQVKQNVADIVVGGGNLCFTHTTAFDKNIFDYFTKKAYSRLNYVQHTTADFEAVMEDIRISGGSATIAYKGEGGSVGGVLFAYPENGYLRIAELFADNDTIRDNLIRSAARYHKYSHTIRYELPNHSATEEPFGMARIINAKTILDLYAAARPNEAFRIKLTDEQLVFNTGYYHIKKGTCIFCKKQLKGEYLELATQQLSAFIFDRARLYMSLMLE